MTEQDIRVLVRDAIARRAGAAASASVHGAPVHEISHGLFVLPESEGPCIIEPSVTCNHCGYCKSYGH